MRTSSLASSMTSWASTALRMSALLMRLSSRVDRSGAARRIIRVEGGRPAQPELRDVAQHVVAREHRPPLQPRDQVVEGALAHAIEAAVPRPPHRSLDEKVRGTRGEGALPIALL